MNEKLNIHYDEEGDLLEIQIGEPSEAYYEKISDGVFERIDEKTGEIKGIAVFSFKKRTSEDKEINVKLPFKFKLVN